MADSSNTPDLSESKTWSNMAKAEVHLDSAQHLCRIVQMAADGSVDHPEPIEWEAISLTLRACVDHIFDAKVALGFEPREKD